MCIQELQRWPIVDKYGDMQILRLFITKKLYINNKRVLQFSSIAKKFVYLSFEEYEVNIHNAIVHKI